MEGESNKIILPTEFLNNNFETVDSSILNGVKVVAFYFYQNDGDVEFYLQNFYNHLNKDEKKFEVIFVSTHDKFQDFKKTFKNKKWLAIKYKDVKEWAEKFKIQKEKPEIILCTPSGEILVDKYDLRNKLLSLNHGKPAYYDEIFEKILINKQKFVYMWQHNDGTKTEVWDFE